MSAAPGDLVPEAPSSKHDKLISVEMIAAALRKAADMPSRPISVPVEGEGFLSAETCAAVLQISESTWWAWVAEPGFPVQPVRRGERWTRFRLSELRAWMASLEAGEGKESPAQRKRSKAAVA